eukprot:CAMPEP_0173114362 /NCGR_PEP_ID=MMETSP1102-20130122/47608_1 /TAXON_ID=49646 /ORGANISM="Geminigera sp., Strain Caron Lab Isolate" /LENGTH=106 /DNA_ID=CAMNT_0014016689 /DNA_START=50 /DNA_END=371 /DNA_ORIENTATION=-
MRSKDIEFAAAKLPRCLVEAGVKVELGGTKAGLGRFDEAVAPSTRVLGTIPDGPGFITWQEAAPPAEERVAAAPAEEHVAAAPTPTRQAAAISPTRPAAGRSNFTD